MRNPGKRRDRRNLANGLVNDFKLRDDHHQLEGRTKLYGLFLSHGDVVVVVVVVVVVAVVIVVFDSHAAKVVFFLLRNDPIVPTEFSR